MADTIIFESDYMTEYANKHLKAAKSDIDTALEKLKKAKMSGSWLCPERDRINSEIEFYIKNINHLSEEVWSLANALILGVSMFNEWEISLQGMEGALSSALKDKYGVDASILSKDEKEGVVCKLPTTPVPSAQLGLYANIGDPPPSLSGFADKLP